MRCALLLFVPDELNMFLTRNGHSYSVTLFLHIKEITQ